jgi:hypothetical protein
VFVFISDEPLRALSIYLASFLGPLVVLHLVVKHVWPGLMRVRTRRHFAEDPAGDKIVEVTVDPSAIVSKVEGLSEKTRAWEAVTKVTKMSEGFLFVFRGKAKPWIWLPDHAFSSKDDIKALCDLARQYAPEYQEAA